MMIGTKLKHDTFLGIEKGTYDHHVSKFMEANNLVVIPPEKLCGYLSIHTSRK